MNRAVDTAAAPEATADDPATLLKAGRFADAAAAARARVARDVSDVEARYLLAAALRYAGDPASALQEIDSLCTEHPAMARAAQERAHALRDLGRTDEAAAAYLQAGELNPALEAAWRGVRDHADEAAPARRLAEAHLERLAATPREIVGAEALMHDGKLYKAEHVCRAFLRTHPKNVPGMRLLAELGARLHILDDAEFLLESAIAFAPGDAALKLDYMRILHRRQKHAEALAVAEALYGRDPENPAFVSALANARMAIGAHEEAIELYDRLIGAFPQDPTHRLARGHALKTVGRTDEAIKAYRAAYSADESCGDAYWSLANLKTYAFTDDEIRRMEEVARKAAGADLFHLHYALGKALEDRGEIDRSFFHYTEGARIKRADLRYEPDRMQAEFDTQKAFFTPERARALEGRGDASDAPIFIVGLPRAGSTLLEQILASHSMVDGTLELPHVLALAHRLNGRRRIDEAPRYPGVLADMSDVEIKACAEGYLEETAVYREGAPRFTDKMPNNFRHIGLIRTILPNAKIIDARRDAMACCFSGFKQLFAEGQEFSYGLDDIGRYYRGYVDLMDHWNAVYPGAILRVRHEDVVDDLEGQVRRVLDFCGLPFEEACVNFHETERSVRTASSEQVRRPIYRTGLDQWRRFETHLDPLKHALGPELVQS